MSAWWSTSPSSTRACRRSSVGLDPSVADHFSPAGVFGTKEASEFLRADGLRLDALRDDRLARFWILERFPDQARESVHGRGGRLCRSEDAVPRARLVTAQSLLVDGRQLGRGALAVERRGGAGAPPGRPCGRAKRRPRPGE